MNTSLGDPPDTVGGNHIHPSTNTTSVCTLSCCTDEEDIYKLRCSECKRLVHYKCTQLPAYQLYRLTITGYRKYICMNCTDILKYLCDLVQKPETSPSSHTKTMTELTAALNQSAEEYETLKVRYQVLENEHDQSQREAANETQLSKEESVVLTYSSEGILEHENTETSKENENKPNAIISRQLNEMKELEAKFAQANKPDFNALLEIEKTIESKIDRLGTGLKETLLEVVEDNNSKLENKLNEVVYAQRTYASAAQGSAERTSGQPNIPVNHAHAQNNDFRSIVRATKNEELAEEREIKLRSRNLILHGVPEPCGNVSAENKKMDEEYVVKFIDAVQVAVTFKSVSRIGRPDQEDKKRPIKIIMNSEEDKMKVLDNLRNLKDNESFKRLSVTDDYTVAERYLLKEYSLKAKEMNDKESPDCKYVWRVRGTPKNGLDVKRLMKRGLVTPQN